MGNEKSLVQDIELVSPGLFQRTMIISTHISPNANVGMSVFLENINELHVYHSNDMAMCETYIECP